MRRWAFAAALAIGAAFPGVATRAETIPASFTVRNAGQDATLSATVYRPEGAASPRPAVVLMHGCSGVGANQRDWAASLNGWGYVAMAVDSFAGRGLKEVCTPANAGKVTTQQRASDVAAAIGWLRTQSYVAGDRIGLMGASHGGETVLFATLKRTDAASWTAPAPAFVAAIAFYPGCTLRGSDADGRRYESQRPLQILIGEKDDWTPPAACERLLGRVSGPTAMKVYPGAVHAFDSIGSKLRYRAEVGNRNKPGGCCGAWVGYDDASYWDSVKVVQAFWLKHLGPGK